MTGVLIREASASDVELIVGLLAACELGHEDILVPGSRYWLAEDGGDLPAGVVGLEYGEAAVLLRSAGVRPDARRAGVGGALVRRALEAAREDGLARAYCFSTDAGSYWVRCGFREAPVPELVAELPAAPQVLRYAELGWLPTEVAYRLDLS